MHNSRENVGQKENKLRKNQVLPVSPRVRPHVNIKLEIYYTLIFSKIDWDHWDCHIDIFPPSRYMIRCRVNRKIKKSD